jgi:hypothetical protein
LLLNKSCIVATAACETSTNETSKQQHKRSDEAIGQFHQSNEQHTTREPVDHAPPFPYELVDPLSTVHHASITSDEIQVKAGDRPYTNPVQFTISPNSIQSNPIQSNPIQSNPI